VQINYINNFLIFRKTSVSSSGQKSNEREDNQLEIREDCSDSPQETQIKEVVFQNVTVV